MAKLYFRYSTMNAGKTLNLLSVVYNYEENGENPILFTSDRDDRYEKGMVVSRTGLKRKALIVDNETNMYDVVSNLNDVTVVLVDESQFLTRNHIFQLADIVDKLNIPVICYGLRSSFDLEYFEGSAYLLTISDTIEEIKTICSICKKKKATVNARLIDGKITLEGEQIQIGGNETYQPMCRKCFKENINKIS